MVVNFRYIFKLNLEMSRSGHKEQPLKQDTKRHNKALATDVIIGQVNLTYGH